MQDCAWFDYHKGYVRTVEQAQRAKGNGTKGSNQVQRKASRAAQRDPALVAGPCRVTVESAGLDRLPEWRPSKPAHRGVIESRPHASRV